MTHSLVTCAARQAHGFLYQSNVIQRLKLKEISSYTAQYDACYQGTPVQIKCMKQGSEMRLGDYRRNKHKKEDFIMIVGIWNQSKHRIIHEDVRYIRHQSYTKNMGFGYYNDYIERQMFLDLKSLSNSYADDILWKEFCARYKNFWQEENKIDLRFARDHKTQKRIQCSIGWQNYTTWYKQEFEVIEELMNK